MSPAPAPAPAPARATKSPTQTPPPTPATRAPTETPPPTPAKRASTEMPPPTPAARAPTGMPIGSSPTQKLSSSTPVRKTQLTPTPMAIPTTTLGNAEEHVQRTPVMQCSKASLTFGDDESLKAVGCPMERKDLFESNAVELQKPRVSSGEGLTFLSSDPPSKIKFRVRIAFDHHERSKAVAEYKMYVAEYRAFLESCNFIKETTQWEEVQEWLEDEEQCSRLEKIDRLAIFQEYIRHLEKEEERQKQIKKLLKKDKEIEFLRARMHEVEALKEKLEKNLEEAWEMLRNNSITDKGTADDLNEAHDPPRVHSSADTDPDKRSTEGHSGHERRRHHKRSGGRSRMASRIARCHDIIVCENEAGALQVLELLRDGKYEILHEVNVPGVPSHPCDKDKPKKKLESLTPFGKILFLGMIDCLYRLHRAGLSLNGNFELEDFYWLSNKKVKLSADLKRHMLRRSPKRMNRDYKKLCKLLKRLLAKCNIEIPTDVKFLLNLMNSDNPMREQMLIRYNICLMDEISKGTYTLTLYGRLEQLDAEDSKKFGFSESDRQKWRSATVYDYVIAGDEDWSSAMTENTFVKLIYDRWSRDTNFPNLKRRHLVELLRHCIVHLPEKAYLDGKIHYTDANVPSMIEMVSPGLLSEFQAGMYVIKQIAYPHLMRVMRA